MRLTSRQAQLLAERSDVVTVHLEANFVKHEWAPTDVDLGENARNERKTRAAVTSDDATTLADADYVNADKAWAKGYQGQGYAVAILDDGINAQHEKFSGRIVFEACFSTTGSGATSLCPGGANSSTSIGAASSACSSTNDVCGHGSHVAAIAVGNNIAISSTLSFARSVAPQAGIVPIQVFRRYASTDKCDGLSSCLLSSSFDLAAALDWIIANAAKYNIVAVNMSLGSGTYSSYCDNTSVLTTGINTLHQMNVLTVIAAGNDGEVGLISHPACVRNAVAVSERHLYRICSERLVLPGPHDTHEHIRVRGNAS